MSMTADATMKVSMEEKIALIRTIFEEAMIEEAEAPDLVDQAFSKSVGTIITHGQFYGGFVNGRKFMYSTEIIEGLSIDRLERLIRSQTGLVSPKPLGKQTRIKKTKPV